MSLRRSPLLTPGSLAARRANALKSTGPRTTAGKARSCLNALRHGRRARDLRAKLARTGDSEAVFLLDWFHHHILGFWQPQKDRTWRYTIRLAARVWCFMNGFSLRPRAGESQEKVNRRRALRTYRYSDARDCSQRSERAERPQALEISYKRGPGVRFLNPTPTRRRHVLLGWLPEFRRLPGPAPKVKRVRGAGPEPGRGWNLASDGGGFDACSQTAVEGVIKNEVPTKLECCKESMTCQDSSNPWRQGSPEAAIAPFDDSLQSVCEESCSEIVGATPSLHSGQALVVAHGRAGTRPAPTATPSPPSSCEVTFAEEEPWVFADPDDDDSEVFQASRALIELQWSKWRQAISDARAAPGEGALTGPGHLKM